MRELDIVIPNMLLSEPVFCLHLIVRERIKPMKVGKGSIHKLPVNDITSLGVLAQQLQLEAESSGNALPAAARLHIGEPSFRTPEHICLAAIEAIQNGQITYGPPAGWHW